MISEILLTSIVQLSAHVTIPVAEVIASDAATKELKAFRTGRHDGLPSIYADNSDGMRELLEGNYYQELSEYLIDNMAKWYGGHIPHDNGLFHEGQRFRIFAPSDALREMFDGIDMADVIGSMTYSVRVTSNNGKLNFFAINVMSLGSYAGENYLGYHAIDNPESGSFKPRVQVFQWQQDIPAKYIKTNE